jgi:hypothetical protein
VAAAFKFTPAPGSAFPVGKYPVSVAEGDFNGDGKPDVAVADLGALAGQASSPGSVSVLLGKGGGRFSPGPGSPLTVGVRATSVAVGDFNGDHTPDLAVANYSDNTVSVLLGDGSGGFSPVPGSPFSVGAGPNSVAVGDFNGDHIPDLAVANASDDTVSVLLGTGSGGFIPAVGSPLTVGSSPSSIAVGDFNGDHIPDLAVANYSDNTVSVLLGNGSGGFTPSAASPFPSGGFLTSVAVGDFNGDHKLDLVTADGANGTVSVLLGDGSGDFGPASSFAVGSGAYSVAVGDMNGDHRLDLAVANANDNTVSLLFGDGRGSFSPARGSPITVGHAPFSVAVGDFNSDGALDLAVANRDDSTVSVLLGPRPCTVPSVKGKTLNAAKRSIASHGCGLGKVKQTASLRTKRGHVISQSPRPGSRLKHGAKVNLVVSKGR